MEKDEEFKKDVKEMIDGVLPLIREKVEYGHRNCNHEGHEAVTTKRMKE